MKKTIYRYSAWCSVYGGWPVHVCMCMCAVVRCKATGLPFMVQIPVLIRHSIQVEINPTSGPTSPWSCCLHHPVTHTHCQRAMPLGNKHVERLWQRENRAATLCCATMCLALFGPGMINDWRGSQRVFSPCDPLFGMYCLALCYKAVQCQWSTKQQLDEIPAGVVTTMTDAPCVSRLGSATGM